jgi:hypothetical protein
MPRRFDARGPSQSPLSDRERDPPSVSTARWQPMGVSFGSRRFAAHATYVDQPLGGDPSGTPPAGSGPTERSEPHERSNESRPSPRMNRLTPSSVISETNPVGVARQGVPAASASVAPSGTARPKRLVQHVRPALQHASLVRSTDLPELGAVAEERLEAHSVPRPCSLSARRRLPLHRVRRSPWQLGTAPLAVAPAKARAGGLPGRRLETDQLPVAMVSSTLVWPLPDPTPISIFRGLACGHGARSRSGRRCRSWLRGARSRGIRRGTAVG